MARRSILFSPGDQPDLLRKAPGSGADVVVFDLEDAVAPEQKPVARGTVQSVLGEIDPDCELCVRINPLEAGGSEDIEALRTQSASVDSIMLPKVSGAESVARVREALDDGGMSIPMLTLLETAGGIRNASAIATEPAVDALLLGAEDLAADIGATRTESGTEISYARQRVVLAASDAGIDAIDTLVTDFEKTAHLEADTKRAAQFGFDGKMAIHPKQVTVINETFTPDAEEIEWAQEVLDVRESAENEGHGVFAVDGEMIDAPLVAQAEQIIERARAADQIDTRPP